MRLIIMPDKRYDFLLYVVNTLYEQAERDDRSTPSQADPATDNIAAMRERVIAALDSDDYVVIPRDVATLASMFVARLACLATDTQLERVDLDYLPRELGHTELAAQNFTPDMVGDFALRLAKRIRNQKKE